MNGERPTHPCCLLSRGGWRTSIDPQGDMAPRDDRVEHGAGIPPGGAPEEFRTARLRAWRISRRDLAPMAAMNADPRVM